MLAKIIRSLYYILFFAVPLIVIPTTSELFELNKMILIYVAALFVFCFGAVDIILHRKPLLEKTPMNIPFAAFFTVLLLSLLFSIDRHTSIFGYYGRFNGGVLSILAFLVLYFGLVRYFTRAYVINLLRVSVVTSALVMVWGLSGKLGHDFSCIIFTGHFDNSCWTDQFRPAERMFSTLGQPNWLGAYLAAHFFIGLYLYISQTKQRVNEWLVNIPYGIYLVVTFVCLLFSRSRSALIAWGVGVFIFVLYRLIRQKKESLKPYMAIGVACLFAVLIFKSGIDQLDRFITLPSHKAAPKTTSKVEGGPSQAPQLSSEVTESFDIRKIVWKGAWELGKKYPILGTGPETFAYSYYFVRPQEHNMTSEWDYIYNKAHNEYLNYLATTGFTGLAAYLAVIGATIYVLCRGMSSSVNQGVVKPTKKALDSSAYVRDDKELFYLCLLCSYVTVLITNFFGFSTSTSQLVFYLWPALAVAYAVHSTASASKRFALDFWHYTGLAGVAVTGVISTMWLVFFFAADLSYAQGVARLSQGEFQQASANILDALKLHYEHVYEDRLSTSLANVALLSAYGEKPELTSAFIARARQYIDHAITQSPQNMLYWKTRGKNEYTFYQANPDAAYIKEAIKSLERAYELAPTEPKLPYTLGLLYGATNNKITSIEYLDKAIALKPDYLDAYILKLKLFRAWKETEKATAFESQILRVFPALSKKNLEEELK